MCIEMFLSKDSMAEVARLEINHSRVQQFHLFVKHPYTASLTPGPFGYIPVSSSTETYGKLRTFIWKQPLLSRNSKESDMWVIF